jgi:hypothetical protein
MVDDFIDEEPRRFGPKLGEPVEKWGRVFDATYFKGDRRLYGAYKKHAGSSRCHYKCLEEDRHGSEVVRRCTFEKRVGLKSAYLHFRILWQRL